MKAKFLLLVLSLMLLIAAGIYFTVGWYTKMTSVSGMEYSVAQWDFTANYSVGEYEVNVYSYQGLKDPEAPNAAPGTSGEIPIQLSAELSETWIDYIIMIDKTSMSDEFQERIFFYSDPEMTDMLTDENVISGTLESGETKIVYVYWKWIYEFSEIPEGYQVILNETEESFDEFDTQVGKRPDLYEKDMNATLKISGIQTEPTLMTDTDVDPESPAEDEQIIDPNLEPEPEP